MSSRKVEDLNPIFQPMVTSLISQGNSAIGNTGYKFFITDGLRTFPEQTELYASGRTKAGAILTNAKAGESAHNYGLAVDCAFQKDGVLSYDAQLYNRVYPVARILGFILGADWTGFVDKPHFEIKDWRNVITPPTGGTMANMYKGFDLSNTDSMKVAVDILVRVQAGEFVDKSKYQTDVDSSRADGYQKGLTDGKALGGEEVVVDMNKWSENGLLVEENIGSKKYTTNYKLK